MTPLRFLDWAPFFVRPSLLVCTPDKKKPKSQTKFLMPITLRKSQSGNPESKRCKLIFSNLHLLDLPMLLFYKFHYREANLREASTIFVSFILLLPACLGRQKINERKIRLCSNICCSINGT